MNNIFFLSLALFVFSAPAGAVTTGELSDRLDRMEDALKGVQKKLSNNYIGSSKRPAAAADGVVADDKLDAMLLQVQDAEQNLRQMTGEIEKLHFKQEELQNSIDRLGEDMNLRFADIEKRVKAMEDKFRKIEEEKEAAEKAQKEAEKKKKEQEEAAAKAVKEIKDKYGKKTAKDLYAQARASLQKNNYKSAQTEFEAFLTLYPKHDLAGNAQYWLGESFFAREMYQKAAVAFAEGFQNYRNSQKASDNLFKLGVTMARLKKKEEACIAFRNFTKEYPKAPDAMKKRIEAEIQKLSCP